MDRMVSEVQEIIENNFFLTFYYFQKKKKVKWAKNFFHVFFPGGETLNFVFFARCLKKIKNGFKNFSTSHERDENR